MWKKFKRLFRQEEGEGPVKEMGKASSETGTLSPPRDENIEAYDEDEFFSLSKGKTSEMKTDKKKVNSSLRSDGISGFEGKQPIISHRMRYFRDVTKEDRAGVDEEQIKVSMERGLMSKQLRQYEQIKQLKESTTITTTSDNNK